MDLQTIILITIGLVSGVISGVLGIGGAVIMIPALVYFCNLTQHQAQGTTLALMLPPISLLAVMAYHKQGHIDLRIAALVCLGFFFGSYFGGKIAVVSQPEALKKVFAVGLLLISLKMLFWK